MADGISAGVVEAVQRRIYEALAQTSERSLLPEEEQDKLLAEACAESCSVLGGWLASPEWEAARPAGRAPIADAIPDWQRIRPFLDPVKEALTAIAQRQQDLPGVLKIGDPDAYIDRVIKAAGETARRFRRYDRQALFEEATGRIGSLRDDVCALAGDLRGETKSAGKRAERRRKTRSVLSAVAGLLLTLTLTMAGVGPDDAAQH